MLLSGAQSEFALHVQDQNIWVRSEEKLVQHDWATGKAVKEVALKGEVERTAPSKDALALFCSSREGEELVKVDWKSGEAQTQSLRARPALAAATVRTNRLGAVAARAGGSNSPVALNARMTRTNALTAQRSAGADPALKGFKVSQPDPLPARIAAPAIAAAAVQNKRIEREAFCLSMWTEQLNQAVYASVEIEWSHFDRKASGLDLSDIKNVINQGAKDGD